jgi:hypothetical protein
MPNASGVLVYINDDGSARALTEADKRYVDTEFSPLDGARPYIKSHYSEHTALGGNSGLLAAHRGAGRRAHQPRVVGERAATANTANGGGFDIRTDPET